MQNFRTLIRQAGGSNPRLALAAVVELQGDLAWLLDRAVRLARQEGYDWGRIGRVLGCSRQSVRARFAPKEQAGWPMLDPLPPHSRHLDWTESETHHFFDTVSDARRRQRFDAMGDDEAVPW